MTSPRLARMSAVRNVPTSLPFRIVTPASRAALKLARLRTTLASQGDGGRGRRLPSGSAQAT